MRTGWLVCGLLIPSIVRGAFEPRPAGARNAAMGGLTASGGADGWGANPAQLCRSTSLLFGASLTPGMFGIADLGLVQAMVVAPAGSARLGFSFSRLGTDLYREMQAGVSVATGVTASDAIGVSVQFYRLSIAGYGSAGTAAIDLGMRLQPLEVISVALALTNCTGSAIGACREELPRSFAVALEWNPDAPFCMVLEISKETAFPMIVSWGGECSLAGILQIRAGWTTEYPGLSAGAGFSLSPIRFDYAWRWHSALGDSHTLSVTLEGLF